MCDGHDDCVGDLIEIEQGLFDLVMGEVEAPMLEAVLAAKRITGAFSNSRNEVVANDGSRFVIGYSESAVTLTLK